eukprot:TRINITY_DN24710_c0_g1_i1.p1 TRINITY_DN24710_c0_g1~~TRINITY_DN24710_c0_g1_i1.p1  ORF type:complete len:271 (+),score=25.45 TRINITY_DN24710_c0_g1_i1:19-831(+)
MSRRKFTEEKAEDKPVVEAGPTRKKRKWDDGPPPAPEPPCQEVTVDIAGNYQDFLQTRTTLDMLQQLTGAISLSAVGTVLHAKVSSTEIHHKLLQVVDKVKQTGKLPLKPVKVIVGITNLHMSFNLPLKLSGQSNINFTHITNTAGGNCQLMFHPLAGNMHVEITADSRDALQKANVMVTKLVQNVVAQHQQFVESQGGQVASAQPTPLPPATAAGAIVQPQHQLHPTPQIQVPRPHQPCNNQASHVPSEFWWIHSSCPKDWRYCQHCSS